MPWTVLHVEPDAGEAAMLASVLRDVWPGEFALERVGSLAAAVERLERGGVDAVLLDFLLPDAEGLEALERLAATAPRAPVVVLTEVDDPEVGVEAVRRGAQDFLVKGADGHALGRAIRYAIERKRVESYLLDVARLHENAMLALEEAVAVVDREGHVSAANPAAARLLGLRPEQLDSVDVFDPQWAPRLPDGRPFPTERLPPVAALRSGRPQPRVTIGVRRPDGDEVWISLSARPLQRPGEQAPYAVVTSFSDVSELHRSVPPRDARAAPRA
jgi:PAS domain S-box-containing protein